MKKRRKDNAAWMKTKKGAAWLLSDESVKVANRNLIKRGQPPIYLTKKQRNQG